MLNKKIVSIYAADKNIHFSCYYTFFTSISAQGHFLYTFYARCNSTSYHFVFDRIHASDKNVAIWTFSCSVTADLYLGSATSLGHYYWDENRIFVIISAHPAFDYSAFERNKNDSIVFTLILTLSWICVFFSIWTMRFWIQFKI